MTEVIIAGLGQTTVGEHWDVGLRDLAYYAINAAIKDAGGLRPQSLFVGNMLAPTFRSRPILAHCWLIIPG
jgi:acetyl-CoA C-acetyltransferase